MVLLQLDFACLWQYPTQTIPRQVNTSAISVYTGRVPVLHHRLKNGFQLISICQCLPHFLLYDVLIDFEVSVTIAVDRMPPVVNLNALGLKCVRIFFVPKVDEFSTAEIANP